MELKRKKRIATKITTIFVFAILLIVVPVVWFAYNVYREDSIREHKNRALAITQSLASLIDPDEFLEAIQSGIKTEYFDNLQRQLNQAKADTGVLFMFAVSDTQQGMVTFIEAVLPHEQRMADLGDIVQIPFPEEFFAAQNRGEAGTSLDIASGVGSNNVLAAYAPILDQNGRVIGVFGINENVDEVFANSSAFLWTMITIVAVIVFFAIWLPILWVRYKISAPLQKLCDASENIANGKMNTNISVTSNDEFGVLQSTFLRMQNEIQTVINETENKSREIIRGNLMSDRSDYAAKGDFQRIITSIDDVTANVYQYLNNLNCAIVIFDQEYRFTFINAFAVNQGYDPKVLHNKTIFETMPKVEADVLGKNLDHAKKTEKIYQYQISMITPSGDPFHAEQAIIPIKDQRGKITTYLLMGFIITETVQAKKLTEKISEYQISETEHLTKYLQNGFNQGYMKFDYTPQPHDRDTAAAADSFKQIGAVLAEFAEGISACVNEISYLLQEFADENFDVSVKAYYPGDFSSIETSVKKLTSSIGELISEIQNATARVESGAEQISISTRELTTSFTEQASTMSEVTDAVTVLTEKTQKNAEDAKNANGLSEQVQDVANSSSKHMMDMSSLMEEIKQSSSEIAKVASIIESIAFQTNLLALNASVEAARAGEHGKGFAVVAEEVRNLAGRSSEAAKNTTEMIAKSLKCVDEGVAKSLETADALHKIVDVAANVTNVISNIAHATNEQAEEIQRIQNNMATIYRGAESNALSVQRNSTVSDELSKQANTLMSLVNKFKIGKQ